MELTQTRLLVGDYVRCFAFYRDVLGLEPTFGDESSGYASFRAGEAAFAIFDRREQEEVVELRPVGDNAILAFGVGDVDTFAARLDDHLASAPRDRPDWGLRVAYIRDPDGNLLELHQQIAMEQ